MIHKWFTDFGCGRTSTTDAEHSGRPHEVTTPEIVDKIHDTVLQDRRMKKREIAEIVGISGERVRNILHEHLNIKTLSTRLLTIDQKSTRVTTSEAGLAMFKRNKKEFLRRFITVDET
jgi:predicted XRE-type DNA-binding protein